MKKILILTSLLFVIADLLAQTYYSRSGGGNWNSPSSWTFNSNGSGGAAGVPGRNANVVILNGHNINISATNNNGIAGLSADGLGLPNVGAFTESGTANFYQIGNITVNSGGSITSTTRLMFSGTVTIDGTISSTGDLINVGNLIVSSTASLNLNDDLILTGSSMTQLDNVSNSDDDIYIDHTDARLCGQGVMNVGVNSDNTPIIDYFNSASSSQICQEFTITCGPDPACSGFPTNGTGVFSLDLSGYDYYKYITIRSDKVFTTQNDFPVLIAFSDPDLRTVSDGGHVQSNNGYDIVFSSSNNCGDLSQLNHQVESYSSNGSVGTIVAWVNVPTVSASTDTEIFMYYGNDSVDSDQSMSSTYNNNFTNVYHLNNGDFNDATFWENDATNSGTTNQANGKITSARIFGANDYISMPTTNLNTNTGTWSAWVYSTSFTGNHHYILGHTTLPPYANRFQLYTNDAGGDFDLGLGNNHGLDNGMYNFNLNEWYHVGITWNTGNYTVYVNGISVSSGPYASFTALQTFMDIGNNGYAASRAENWFGYIDEVKASNIVRGTGWLETEYTNQVLPDSFFYVGIELTNECIALPIELLSFNANISGENSVLLTWSTLSETNNNYFTIERSLDLKKWEIIKKIDGAGNSRIKLDYNSLDAEPFQGTSYYRLKQTDFDGKFSYSKTKAVRFNAQQIITLRPNPAKNTLIIAASSTINSRDYILRDISGRPIKVPIKSMDNELHLDVSGLQSGLYFIQYQSVENPTYLKFIKD